MCESLKSAWLSLSAERTERAAKMSPFLINVIFGYAGHEW